MHSSKRLLVSIRKLADNMFSQIRATIRLQLHLTFGSSPIDDVCYTNSLTYFHIYCTRTEQTVHLSKLHDKVHETVSCGACFVRSSC